MNKTGILVIPPDNTILVKGHITGIDSEYEVGRGYINPTDSHIYVYSEHKPTVVGGKPFFWKENGRIEYAKADKGTQQKYKSEYIDYTSLAEIMDNSSAEDTNMTAEQLNDINMSSSRILPDYSDTDDFLKFSIKKVMHAKNVILAKLKSAMKEPWQFNNLRTALYKDTKLTPPNFCRWVELLGVNFQLILTDNGADRLDPMPSSVTYNSITNQCYMKDDYYMGDFRPSIIKNTKSRLDVIESNVEDILSDIDDIDHRNSFLVLEIKDTLRRIREIKESID